MPFNNSVTQLESGSATDGWLHGVMTVMAEWLYDAFGNFDTDALSNVTAKVYAEPPQVDQDNTMPWVFYYRLRPTSRSKGGNTQGKRFIDVTFIIEIYTWPTQPDKIGYEGALGQRRLGDILYNSYESRYGDFGVAGMRKPVLDGGGEFPQENGYVSRWFFSFQVERH